MGERYKKALLFGGIFGLPRFVALNHRGALFGGTGYCLFLGYAWLELGLGGAIGHEKAPLIPADAVLAYSG